MCLVEKVDIDDDGNDDEVDEEEGDDDDDGNDDEDDVEEGVDDDDDDDGQVCLLGTGDIDRRRSCISDGGFRLIVLTNKTKMYVFWHYIHYSLIMIIIIITMIMDQLLDQASSYERGGRTCFLSRYRATARNQVSRNVIWEENESNKLPKQRPAPDPKTQILKKSLGLVNCISFHS